MNLLSPHAYSRTNSHFTPKEPDGSHVATNDLLLAALQYDVADQILTPQIDDLGEGRGDYTSPLGLPSELGQRMQIISPVDISRWEQLTSIVSVGSIQVSPHMIHLRNATGSQFPTCGLIHAVPAPNLFETYIATCVLAEEYDYIIASSRAGVTAVRDLLDQTENLLGGRGMAKDACFRGTLAMIPLGIEDSFLDLLPKFGARQILGLAVDEIVILYAGRLTSRYKADLEPLVRIFSILCGETTRLRLIVAGHEVDRGYERMLRGLANRLGVADRLTVYVNYPPYTKKLIYTAADIFVSPVDNIQETFGLSLLEAMAAGLPVVASDWSGYRDLVDNGQTGYLIRTWIDDKVLTRLSSESSLNFGTQLEALCASRTVIDNKDFLEALASLIASPEKRRAMGNAGRTKVKTKFVWSEVIKQYSDLWRHQVDVAAKTNSSRALFIDLGSSVHHYGSEGFDPGTLTVTLPTGLVQEMSNGAGAGSDTELIDANLSGKHCFAQYLSGSEEERNLAINFLKKGIFLAT
jgi:glycosyltransferase involved in cell wall biosynthesis